MNPRTLLAGALLALCATATPATDLLQVWQAARQHDPQGAVSEAGRAAGATRREQAAALWRPNLGLSASAGWANGQSQTNGAQFSALNSGLSDQANFSTSINGGTATRWALNARQPLYSPERQAQEAQLHIAAGVAELRADLAQQQFMLLTAQRYFNLLLAERQEQVLKNQYAAVSRSLTEVKDRFALGDLPVTDTHEAAARATGLQAQLLAAGSEVQMARSVLTDSTRLGADALKPLSPKGDAAVTAVPALVQVLEQVREANLGVRLQKAQQDVARQELKKHQRSGGVTLDLVASAGRDRLSGDGDFGPSTNSQSQQMVGLSLNVPLYTGGWRSAKLQEAVDAQARAEAEVDLAVQQAQQQARSVWLALETGPARLTALKASWQASSARLDATRLGRQVGDRTTLALLQAENDAAQAELALLRAQTELLLTRLQLDALTGSMSVQSLQALNAQLAP